MKGRLTRTIMCFAANWSIAARKMEAWVNRIRYSYIAPEDRFHPRTIVHYSWHVAEFLAWASVIAFGLTLGVESYKAFTMNLVFPDSSPRENSSFAQGEQQAN